MKNKIYLLLVLTCVQFQLSAQCWQKISAGYAHTLAIRTDGTLWAWGLNNSGQLGNGTNDPVSYIPVQVGTATNWASVSAGSEHSMAIKTNGTLWAWGRNAESELGNGTNTDSNVPIQVGTDNDWVAVSAGTEHTLAKKANGTLWSWGGNSVGQCGNGTPPNSVGTPLQIGTDADWESFSTTMYHSMATKSNGTLWVWGRNNSGELGDGTNTDRYTPVQIGSGTNWQTVAAGWSHSLAIKTDGTLWSWGNNNFGALGDGTNDPQNTPIQAGAGTNWQSISAGEDYSVAIRTDGSLWAWGNNFLGQLGISTNTSVSVPTQCGTATNWSVADAGSYFTVSTRADNTAWSWGGNSDGQLGDGTINNQNSPSALNCGGVLPLTWLYFQGRLQNNAVWLKWATASEKDVKEFEIEHSLNGIAYTKVATVAAAGNSNDIRTYSFIHHNAPAGTNYYRIKQTDLNGKFSYSAIVSVYKVSPSVILSVSPNPARNVVMVHFSKQSGAAAIKIIDQQGKAVLQTTAQPGETQRSIDISKLPEGIYTALLQTPYESRTILFVKQ